MKYYLAIDIGASSGRHILGCMENGKLCIEEVYRFENNLKKSADSLIWDIDNLVSQVKEGIRKCKEIGKIPQTVAIDTWGVDYVLLDENKNELLPAFCYRDFRTEKAIPEVEKIISEAEMFKRTGIQKQAFNTVYQLYCDKLSGKLDKAAYCMMMPAYLSYCLTGVIKNEYTNATTGGFINAQKREVDEEITQKLGIDKSIFGEILKPCDEIGNFSDEMQKFCGYNAKVVFCPSHDTASAVAASPIDDGGVYISSGTWSLIGAERKEAIISDEARIAGFTNEGGINDSFRFLKNYMGMWLFQNIRRNLDKSMTYDEMMHLAEESAEYHYIDVNAQEFVAPDDMILAIRTYLGMPELPLGTVLNSVYHSLAKSYGDAVNEIESIAGFKADAVHIVGGGSQDKYLNRLTAQYTGKKVTAGPVEATAIGNLISQIMAEDSDYTLERAREFIKKSFNIEEV